jgi:hypothetical protein
MEEDKFGHNESHYERPNLPYRCGRGSLWQTPCNHGPEVDGSCGGVQECKPFFKKDRWQCRRGKRYGGSCEHGPGPNGECSLQRPPCAPRSTLRVIRGRLVLLAVGIVLAMIGFSLTVDPSFSDQFNFSSAGPLSKSHSKFTEQKGCASCHDAHGKGPVGWVKAVFNDSDISSNCVNCHSFGGPSFEAHNAAVPADKETQNIKCIMCHREHNGPKMITKSLTPAQCGSCHKNKFESFEKGHPEFTKKYPYFDRNSIKFDHISHLKKHFDNEKFSDKAPDSCLGCHTVTLADREVRPNSYEMICANCHGSQIKKKELILLRHPELMQDLIDYETLAQACNIPDGKKSEEEFLSISTEPPALVSAFLLNVATDDPETYEQPLQDLILAMAEESSAPFAELIDAQTDTPMSEHLLAGLNPEVLKRAACSWGLNVEYEAPADAKFGGWYADMLEVRYKPAGHADPVAKNWIEFALAVTSVQGQDEKAERAVAMQEQILSAKEGVGGCIKCHAITEVKDSKGGSKLVVEWNYGYSDDRPYVRYKHDNHIEILGTKNSCSNCHVLDKQVDYMESFKEYDAVNAVSNFESIKKKTCMQCHSETQINMECQKCHLYHLKPSFKKDMLTVKAELPSPIKVTVHGE